MMKKGVVVAMALLISIWFTESASSLTEIENGLRFLNMDRNRPGGSRDAENIPAEELLATLKALETYGTGQSETRSTKDRGVDATSYIIHKIETKHHAGEDIAVDLKTLLSYRKADGGWGGKIKRTSTNFHTVYAVMVLDKVKYPDRKIIDEAIDYLRSRQNPDGGWGFKKGDDSTVFMAATVLIAFEPFKKNPGVQNSIRKGIAYLLSKQNPDGGFSTE